MMQPFKHVRLVALLLGLAFHPAAVAADWPADHHDVCRSSATDEQPAFPMRETWRHLPTQPPQPAWPEPIHLVNRLDFDYAPHPVCAEGLVCFGSSADDTVRALDLKTGVEKWHFVTGGPVRFAPQIEKGKVYAASDDGFVYCLEAATGKLLWKFRAAPDDDLFVGNNRLISRWPVRTGVLVMEGTVYFAAGVWNTDGIHVCALNAETGDVVWRNDNTGYTGIFFKGMGAQRSAPVANLPKNTTHEGEFGATGITPQGALLAEGNALLIPNGNAFPARFNRQNGEYKPWESAGFSPAPGVGGITGGTWGCIDGRIFYSLSKYRQNILGLFGIRIEGTGTTRHPARADLPQVNIQPNALLGSHHPKNYIHDKGKVSIVVSKGKVYSRHAYGLALAGNTLLVGLDGAVVAQDPSTEKELWRAPIEGIAREFAVADGRILVSTDRGVIHCFESGSGVPPLNSPTHSGSGVPPLNSPDQRRDASATLLEQIKKSGMDRGFALVFGDADAQISLALANATQLKVVNVLTDDTAVTPLRNRLLATTALYGSRLQVLSVSRLDRLPFARYLANAIIIAGPVPGLSARELYRVLRPCGGVLLTPGLKPPEATALAQESGATPGEIGKGDAAVIRGGLVGARDWDKPGAADRALGGPLRVLWFGGPDTAQTQSFRQDVNFPMVASGRYLTLGESRLTSVDAYNGTVQWSRVIPRKNRDLREVDGLIHFVTENNRSQPSMPDPATTPAHAEKAATAKPAPDDSDMVEMPINADPTQGGRQLRIVSAEKAYLILGRDPDETWIEVDARTGQQRHILGKWTSPPIVSLKAPRTWPIEIDAAHSGTVALEAVADGLLFTLTTKDAAVTRLDAWELYCDFRPVNQRCGLYEHGAFQLTIVPAQKPGAPTVCSKGNGPIHPHARVTGDRTADGTKTMVVLPWAELEKITGARPTSFGFAATLNSHDGGPNEKIVRRHLFGDWAAEALNNGWANVFIGEAPAAVEPPAIVTALTNETRKKHPDHQKNRKLQPMVDDPIATGPRVHPLTGDLVPKIYRPGTGGCGEAYYSSTSRFGRATGMLGLYDFIDDSGLRNLCGVKAGCSTPMTTALGLLIISPEGGHCVCTFPLATTITLAPADRRLNEDWALFHDHPADTLVRQAAINLGAFGDRRDEQGTLWLGFPRAPERALDFPFAAGTGTTRAAATAGTWLHFLPAAMRVPLEIEYLDPAKSHRPEDDPVLYSSGFWTSWTANRLGKELGPYRVNTDVVSINGTKQPWIYGSGYRGLKKATLQLDFRTPLMAGPAAAPPVIDGKLSDPAWGDKPDTTLPFTKTQVFLRQDAGNLHIAMKRPPVINRNGATAAWNKTTKGEDADVWEDDSCEVFLTDSASGKVLHLGVSASGARYDALTPDSSQKEDRKWNGAWTSAATGDESALSFEVTVPLKTLTDAGLQKDRLGINVQMNQKNLSGEILIFPTGHGRDSRAQGTSGEALSYLGGEGREHCRNFVPVGLGSPSKIEPRSFTIRLHFAELDDTKPGQRVFDVKLQDQIVLKGFDIVKEAGGVRTALIKEFKNILAAKALTIEFLPAGKELTAATAPILSAIEVSDESFKVEARPSVNR